MSARSSTGGIQSRKRARSTGRLLCTCGKCKLQTVIDPLSNVAKPGRFVGRLEFKEHRQLELRVRLLKFSGSIAEEAVKPMSEASSTDPLESEPEKLFARTPTPKGPSSTPKLKTTTMIIQIQTALETKSVRGCIDTHGLEFSNPPTLLSPPSPTHSDGYTLKQGVRANSKILQYTDWLIEQRGLLKRLSRSLPFGETRLRASVLEMDIGRRMNEIEIVTRKEWTRQRLAAIEAGNDAINTCTSISRRVPCSN